MSTEERSRRATMARVTNAQRRRFQRYLREMRTSGLHVSVSNVTSAEDYAYASDPAAFPTR